MWGVITLSPYGELRDWAPRVLTLIRALAGSPYFATARTSSSCISSNLNYNDEINDLGLPIIRAVKSNPGVKADKIYEILSAGDKGITKKIGQVHRIEGIQKNGHDSKLRHGIP